MTFTASSVWMVRNGGSDANNGGGFDRGVSGMATDGAATTGTGSAPVFSSASYNFVAGDVGAWVYIKSGTNWIPGWYLIASVAANAATLTATIGTATLDAGGLNPTAGCATTASPTGATWSVDYSRQDPSQVTYTDLVIDGTTNTKATSAGNPIKVNQIGNVWNITSGTGFTVQRATLVSISGVTGTFDRSLGTLSSTGGNGRMGGAFASPGMAGSVWQPSNWVYIKYHATPYTTTSTSSNVSGGSLDTSGSASRASPWEILGFDVTPGDATANRPTFKHGASTTGALMSTGDIALVFNIILDGNVSSFNARGFTYSGSGRILIRRCKFTSFGNIGLYMPGGTGSCGNVVDCEFTGCSTSACVEIGNGISANSFYGCVFHDNTSEGCAITGTRGDFVFVSCIFDTCKNGSSVNALDVSSFTATATLTVANCTFYNSGASGIGIDHAPCSIMIINCIFESNGAYGVNIATASPLTMLINNAFYNNSSGQIPVGMVSPFNLVGTVTASASMFVDPANGNFALNLASTGGNLVRSVGFPTSFTTAGAPTANYLDLGAAQTPLSNNLANAFAA